MKRQERIIGKTVVDTITFIACILSCIYYFYNSERMINTINGKFLLIICMIIGLFLFVFFLYGLKKMKIRNSRFLVLTLGFFLITIISNLGYKLNSVLSDKREKEIQSRVIEKEILLIPERHLVGIEIDNKLEKVLIPEKFWNSLNKGDLLKFNISKGFFGFTIVKNIQRAD